VENSFQSVTHEGRRAASTARYQLRTEKTESKGGGNMAVFLRTRVLNRYGVLFASMLLAFTPAVAIQNLSCTHQVLRRAYRDCFVRRTASRYESYSGNYEHRTRHKRYRQSLLPRRGLVAGYIRVDTLVPGLDSAFSGPAFVDIQRSGMINNWNLSRISHRALLRGCLHTWRCFMISKL
jgi:hypothetical protein